MDRVTQTNPKSPLFVSSHADTVLAASLLIHVIYATIPKCVCKCVMLILLTKHSKKKEKKLKK